MRHLLKKTKVLCEESRTWTTFQASCERIMIGLVLFQVIPDFMRSNGSDPSGDAVFVVVSVSACRFAVRPVNRGMSYMSRVRETSNSMMKKSVMLLNFFSFFRRFPKKGHQNRCSQSDTQTGGWCRFALAVSTRLRVSLRFHHVHRAMARVQVIQGNRAHQTRGSWYNDHKDVKITTYQNHESKPTTIRNLLQVPSSFLGGRAGPTPLQHPLPRVFQRHRLRRSIHRKNWKHTISIGRRII